MMVVCYKYKNCILISKRTSCVVLIVCHSFLFLGYSTFFPFSFCLSVYFRFLYPIINHKFKVLEIVLNILPAQIYKEYVLVIKIINSVKYNGMVHSNIDISSYGLSLKIHFKKLFKILRILAFDSVLESLKFNL